MPNNSLGARRRRAAEPKVKSLVLAVDFDGTICQTVWKGFGPITDEPFAGARAVLQAAKDQGDHIIVHSCRARQSETIDGVYWQNTSAEIADWMNHHGIPFDEITAVKPIADVYLDDKAIQFTDWHTAALDLMNLRRVR